MPASEKAVAAVEAASEAHGVFVTKYGEQTRYVLIVSCKCGAEPMRMVEYRRHLAVAAADAAVDADRSVIQAAALREQVDVFDRLGWAGSAAAVRSRVERLEAGS